MNHILIFDLRPVAGGLYYQPHPHMATAVDGVLVSVTMSFVKKRAKDRGFIFDEPLEKLLKLAAALSPKKLENKYNKIQKNRKPKTLKELAEDRHIADQIRNETHANLHQFLTSAKANNQALSLKAAGASEPQKRQLKWCTKSIQPILFFDKKAAQFDFSINLQLDNGTLLFMKNITLLSQRKPAWFLHKNEVYCLPAIEGKLLAICQEKSATSVPILKGKNVLKSIVDKVDLKTEMHVEGFHFSKKNQLEKAVLQLQAPFMGRDWHLGLSFFYDKKNKFNLGQNAQQKFVFDTKDLSNFDFSILERNASAETDIVDFLIDNGLKRFENAFLLAENDKKAQNDFLIWAKAKRGFLEKNGIVLDISAKDGQSYYLGDIKTQNKISKKRDWFDVSITIKIGVHQIDFIEFVPYIKRNDDHFPLPDGTWFLIPESWSAKYSDFIKETNIKKEIKTLRIPASLGHLVPFKVAQINALSQPDFLPVKWNKKDLKATLRSYQKDGVQWMLPRLDTQYGVCLADDMGLGKNSANDSAFYTLESKSNQ